MNGEQGEKEASKPVRTMEDLARETIEAAKKRPGSFKGLCTQEGIREPTPGAGSSEEGKPESQG